MIVKSSKTLVTFPRNGEIVVYNYLSKDAITCAPDDIYWVTVADEWVSIEHVIDNHPQLDEQSIRAEISMLVEAGILLEQGSDQAKREAKYQARWELGHAAGIFHFTLLDNEYVESEEWAEKHKAKSLLETPPSLFAKNTASAIALPKPQNTHSGELFKVMHNRRSIRNVKPSSITLQQLSEALYAGLGITGLVKTETGYLPLKMTPSGGARNPFEAYVYVRNVSGLEPGIYHYSAIQHTLERQSDLPAQTPADLLTKQEWTNSMCAVIFLVAMLERTTWKYNDPNAYRVVLIEAGHIAQNIMLASTSNKLTACATAALCHSQISNVLGLEDITETPIYALLIGNPGENVDTILPTETAIQMNLTN